MRVRNKEPPKLVRNRPPARLLSIGAGKHGFTIGWDELMATSSQQGARPSDITYVIVSGVHHGRLEHLETGRLIRRRFTQQDVNDGKVVYVINDHPMLTNDSFVFRVQDQRHNILDHQTSVSRSKICAGFTRLLVDFVLF